MTGGMTLGSILGSVAGGWMLDRFGVHPMLGLGVATAVVGSLLVIWALRLSSARPAALTTE
jgi:uncharacterized membrane protein YeaQ/YmgE (transglycosylase-associated protein family)